MLFRVAPNAHAHATVRISHFRRLPWSSAGPRCAPTTASHSQLHYPTSTGGMISVAIHATITGRYYWSAVPRSIASDFGEEDVSRYYTSESFCGDD